MRVANIYFRAPAKIVADEMAARLDAALKANAQAIGPNCGLAEIRGYLTPADSAALTAAVFAEIAVINNYGVVEK